MKIIDQIIEYDKSTSAWGRFNTGPGMTVDLVKYYDDRNAAILATLPEDLRAWVEAHTGEPRRVLRAAVLLAEERVTPDAEANPGTYTIRSKHNHTCNVTSKWCTCEDWKYTKASDKRNGVRCKHLYAAEKLYNEFKAEYYSPPTPNLWKLAQAAIKEHLNDAALDGLVIWRDASDTRHATLIQIQSSPYATERTRIGAWLYLEISGHSIGLQVATLRHGIMSNTPRWEFDARESEYKEWVRELQS